jgi:hypothetical protein
MSLLGTGFLLGGVDGGGLTGITVYPIARYVGNFPVVVTGSGIYTTQLTGQYYLPYIKTFTGSWDLLTGESPTSLVSVKTPSTSTDVLMSGSGLFPPNSYINFQVAYSPSGTTSDAALLIISGVGVINPIYQVLNQP